MHTIHTGKNKKKYECCISKNTMIYIYAISFHLNLPQDLS